jgi:hypothetical protein
LSWSDQTGKIVQGIDQLTEPPVVPVVEPQGNSGQIEIESALALGGKRFGAPD